MRVRLIKFIVVILGTTIGIVGLSPSAIAAVTYSDIFSSYIGSDSFSGTFPANAEFDPALDSTGGFVRDSLGNFYFTDPHSGILYKTAPFSIYINKTDVAYPASTIFLHPLIKLH